MENRPDNPRRLEGDVFEERDPSSGQKVVKRIRNGREQERIQSPVGNYWADSKDVVRYPDGRVIDFS